MSQPAQSSTQLAPSDTIWIARLVSAFEGKREATFTGLMRTPVSPQVRTHALDRLLRHKHKIGRVREEMLVGMIDQTELIIPSQDKQDRIFVNSIERHLWSVIPALHQCQFTLAPNAFHRQLLFDQIKQGHWPSPDLLMPDILDWINEQFPMFGSSILSKPKCLREDFICKLVRFANGPGIDEMFIYGLFGSCTTGIIDQMIQEGTMHRSQIVSSLAVLCERGWLHQEGLNQVIARHRGSTPSPGTQLAQALLAEASQHILQGGTMKANSTVRVRRI